MLDLAFDILSYSEDLLFHWLRRRIIYYWLSEYRILLANLEDNYDALSNDAISLAKMEDIFWANRSIFSYRNRKNNKIFRIYLTSCSDVE